MVERIVMMVSDDEINGVDEADRRQNKMKAKKGWVDNHDGMEYEKQKRNRRRETKNDKKIKDNNNCITK